MISIKKVNAKHFMTPTKLGDYDFTCNPYVGCENGCLYCYAATMPDALNREVPWGSYVDVRSYPNFNIPKNTGRKSLFFSSMTDCYQPIESNIRLTRKILEEIYESQLEISILTKSHLVTRDIDLFQNMQNLKVGFSISLLDSDATIFEPHASKPSQRMEALKTLKHSGIYTYVFISPIIPFITDVFSILDSVRDYVDEVMFDTLNLKDTSNKQKMFQVIDSKYPHIKMAFHDVFESYHNHYYSDLKEEIINYVNTHQLKLGYLYK
jgi:DNA repair photolyase